MASLYLLKSTFSPFSVSRPSFPGKSSDSGKRTGLKLRSYNNSFRRQKLQTFCSVQEEADQSNGEERPESLFMKELKRRGMTPTSLIEETNKSNYGVEDELKLGEEDDDDGVSLKRNAVSTDQREIDKSLSNQRDRSMALNSEGLEGLVPRAKLLLTIGGTFFLGFWPLIVITTAFFSALCFYFGPTFVHDASKTPVSAPQYVDPYELLEDERISQMAPSLK